MPLTIYKTQNKYAFAANSFASEVHYYLLPFVKPKYNFAWQAERDGRKVLKHFANTNNVLIRNSQDFVQDIALTHDDLGNRVANHFWKVYDNLVDSAHGSKDADDDIKEKTYKEIVIVTKSLLETITRLEQDTKDQSRSIEELRTIIGKLGSLTKQCFPELLENDLSGLNKQASSNANTSDVEDDAKPSLIEILEYYATIACEVLQKTFPEIVYILDEQNCLIDLVKNDSEDKILRIMVDPELLFVTSINPYKCCPNSNSFSFYQFFWKPIVERIGHFVLPSGKIIIAGQYLPDITHTTTNATFEVTDPKTMEVSHNTIHFNVVNSSWKILNVVKTAQISKKQEYSEIDFIGVDGSGAMVVCVDRSLESIYQKTGHVKTVNKVGNEIYVSVDFGNHIVSLKSTQINVLSV